jgi:DNA-binding response OmpR family regulator
MAATALENLIAVCNEQLALIDHMRRVEWEEQQKQDALAAGEGIPPSDEPQQIKKPVFKDFTVTMQGRSLELGNTKPYQVLKRLCQTPNQFIHIDTLIQDVWHGKPVSDEAVQRQMSKIRKSLKDAGIDGIVIESQPGHYRVRFV